MNIGLFLGHPAHFHMLKNAALQWQHDGYQIYFVIKKKDILEQLLQDAGYSYTLIREGRKDSFCGLVHSVISMEWNMCKFLKQKQIDILVGSTLSFASHVLMHVPTIVMGEDDAAIVPKYASMVYPFADAILTPAVCNNGEWDSKSIKYPSYHELAYLHPHHFVANREVVEQYGINTEKPYFVLRFASLKAHHDGGIRGINTEIAQHLIDLLRPHGQIYITSERPLEPQFETYRIHINPLDMHHVMAFASLYLGDSQTMAAEAGVLGTPFVRFNDFVGRIGYLRELEDRYQLGYGVHATPLDANSSVHRLDGSLQPSGTDALYEAVERLVALPPDERRALYQQRRAAMLSEKIDYAEYLTWFVERYPESVALSKQGNADFWQQFHG